MAVILALDQGTTSSRAFVFDAAGRALACAQRELKQYFPQPGWVEHDPEEIWQSQCETAREALRAAGVRAEDVAAIGITNQRETTLLWDRATGVPLARAVVWQDRRTASVCETLRARGLSDTVSAQTGLVCDPYFSATKIAWLLDNCEGARTRAERGELAFGTVDTWLIWKLTGGTRHVTDVTNASRTMLFDIHRLEWSIELTDALGIPRTLLAEVLPNTADFGTANADIFGAPIRIAGVAGDQQAALIGQAGFDAGIAKNTYGTGSFVVLNTGSEAVRSSHGLLTTVAHAFDARHAAYALEGSVFSAGAAIQWLRDGLQIVADASGIEALARSCETTEGVAFVPAFTGLGAPYWDPHARGIITGITRGTHRGHIARAALEAIAFQSRDVIEAMERDSGIRLKELRVDGGGAVNDLLMQLQADFLDTTVVRPHFTETTALGAAYLAGLQSGFWSGVEALRAQWQAERRFAPAISAEERARRVREWHTAVKRAATA